MERKGIQSERENTVSVAGIQLRQHEQMCQRAEAVLQGFEWMANIHTELSPEEYAFLLAARSVVQCQVKKSA